MKNQYLHSAISLLESFSIAFVFILLGAIATAKAQNNFPSVAEFDSSLNGLFSPTASERFFNAGREDFEDEIDFINNSDIYDEDLLSVDEDIREQIKQIQLQPFNSSQDDIPVSESVTGY